jgi:thiol-disulfide isomerase/thioredoxin
VTRNRVGPAAVVVAVVIVASAVIATLNGQSGSGAGAPSVQFSWLASPTPVQPLVLGTLPGEAALREVGTTPAGPLRSLVPAQAGRAEVVAFFASWCTGCRADMATLARVFAHGPVHGVGLEMVAVDDSPAAARGIMRSNGLSAPSAVLNGADEPKWLDLAGLPSTLIIAHGRIVARAAGPLSAPDLLDAVYRVDR